MAVAFERQVLKMFEGEKKQNTHYHRNTGSKYLEKEYIKLRSVSVSGAELKKGLKKAFVSHKEYFNNDGYVNETYFYSIVTDILLSLHNSPDVVGYYKEMVNCFDELHDESPGIFKEGYFHFSFLYSISKFEDMEKLDEVVEYYDKDGLRNRNFNNVEKMFIEGREFYYQNHLKKFRIDFLEREINYGLIKVINLLNKVSFERQEKYKILFWENIGKEHIGEILKLKKDFNYRPAESLDIKNIRKDILLEVLGDENIFELRKNDFVSCRLNSGLNDFLVVNYSKEKVIDVLLERLIKYNDNAKLLNYDKKVFGDGCFYRYMKDEHVKLLIDVVMKSKMLSTSNNFFNKMKCKKNDVNNENLIRAFIAKEKAKEEVKVLSLEVNCADEAVRKRL